MTRGDFYTVVKGHRPGIYTEWEGGAEVQVKGFSGAKYKKCKTRQSAEEYLIKNGVSVPSIATQEEEEEGEEEEGEEEEESSEFVSDFSGMSLASNADEPIASKYHERRETPTRKRPDPRDPGTLVAFCDGSGLDNGKPDCRGGYAALFPHCSPAWDVVKEIEDGKRATNERADCYAVLAAMEHANIKDPNQDQALVIFTNHLNVIKSMTRWIDKWRRNGWLRTNDKPVENRDLFEKLLLAQEKRHIVWAHLNKNSEMSAWEKQWSTNADRAARKAAHNADRAAQNATNRAL